MTLAIADQDRYLAAMPADTRSMLDAEERKLFALSDDLTNSESALGQARDALVQAKLAAPGKRPKDADALTRTVLEREADHTAATEAHRRQLAHLDELRQAIAGKAHAAEVERLDAELERTRAEYARRFPALEKAVHDLTSSLEALEALRHQETELATKRVRLTEREDGRVTDIDQYRRLPGHVADADALRPADPAQLQGTHP